jgi:hypothetical protein
MQRRDSTSLRGSGPFQQFQFKPGSNLQIHRLSGLYVQFSLVVSMGRVGVTNKGCVLEIGIRAICASVHVLLSKSRSHV